MILTIDLGTSRTKVALWDEAGLVGIGRAAVATAYPRPFAVEQDPSSWWPSVVDACQELRRATGPRFADVGVIGFATARQTIAPFTAGGEPLAPALVWSDRRAAREADALAEACGGPAAVWRRTGIVLDAGAVAAKVAWLSDHLGAGLSRCRWILGPRDAVIWHMSGEVATDVTVASASGLYGFDGDLLPELAGPVAGLVPEPVEPATVVGALRPEAAGELGLPAGLPIVVGAGDRACEALGTGASSSRATVSWGTTANVSLPVDGRPDPCPSGLQITRAATGGWLLEGGVSAAGALLDWLGKVVGMEPRELVRLAAGCPPGADGVIALPWLGGARAPWWRDAGAAFVGLNAATVSGDLARALLEAVAWDLGRCLDRMEPRPECLSLAGDGFDLWHDIVTAVTALPGTRRASGEAASAGAALLAGPTVGLDLDPDRINPVVADIEPEPAARASYEALRPLADRVAGAVIGLLAER